MGRLVIAAVLFIGALGARTASAQELRAPRARQGYYIGAGLRTGVTAAENENVGSFGALTHFGGVVRFGQMTLPWLGLGISGGGGNEQNGDWSLGYGGLQLEVQVEPFDLDLAFRIAAGVAGGRASRIDEAEAQEDDPDFFFGSSYAVGVSYDWFPFYTPSRYDSGGLALTLFAEGRYTPGGDVNLGGGFLGVEVTWWTGLPKRKLALPVEQAF